MEKSLSVSQKVKYTPTMWSSHLRYLLSRNESMCPYKDLDIHALKPFCNSQKLEITPMKCYSVIKMNIIDTCYNMDEPHNNYAERTIQTKSTYSVILFT